MRCVDQGRGEGGGCGFEGCGESWLRGWRSCRGSGLRLRVLFGEQAVFVRGARLPVEGCRGVEGYEGERAVG